jgi:hypothetical protein
MTNWQLDDWVAVAAPVVAAAMAAVVAADKELTRLIIKWSTSFFVKGEITDQNSDCHKFSIVTIIIIIQ